MCGICGFVNVDDEYRKKMLIHLNVSRGHDSTGACSIIDGEWVWKKVAKSADKLLEEDSSTVSDGEKSTVSLWHTRAASPSGLIAGSAATDENAHPFEEGETIGAHNGIWYNNKEIAKKYEVPEASAKVDSNVAIWMIEHHGEESMKEFEGKGAMWWVNKTDTERFHLWTWDKELAIAEKEGMFMFSSDIRHLKMVTDDSWNLSDLITEGQTLTINTKTGVLEEVGKITASKKAAVVYTGAGYGGWYAGNTYKSENKWSEFGSASKKKSSKIINFDNSKCKVESTSCFAEKEGDVYKACKMLASMGGVYRCDKCCSYYTTYRYLAGIKTCPDCSSPVVVMTPEEREWDMAIMLSQLSDKQQCDFIRSYRKIKYSSINLDNVETILGENYAGAMPLPF